MKKVERVEEIKEVIVKKVNFLIESKKGGYSKFNALRAIEALSRILGVRFETNLIQERIRGYGLIRQYTLTGTTEAIEMFVRSFEGFANMFSKSKSLLKRARGD